MLMMLKDTIPLCQTKVFPSEDGGFNHRRDNKSNQRWIWYAVEHSTNTILAYVFGKRKDVVFKELQALLKPFNIKRYYTDDWGAYERNIPTNEHEIGKTNTQIIERKNLNLRTWIKRLSCKTICFSKCEEIHDIVIGLRNT